MIMQVSAGGDGHPASQPPWGRGRKGARPWAFLQPHPWFLRKQQTQRTGVCQEGAAEKAGRKGQRGRGRSSVGVSLDAEL